MKVLMIHQGSELYGSDRSFITAVDALVSSGVRVDVVLPARGEINNLIDNISCNVIYMPCGVIRKKNLKRPFWMIKDLFDGVLFYKGILKEYDIIYINTVVVFSALIAVRFFKKKSFCHIREIPSGLFGRIIKSLVCFSKTNLIFNSLATQNYFKLNGTVIYNGVAEPVSFYKEIDFWSCTPLEILLVGRINSWKGHSLLFKSLILLPDNILKRINISVVGSVFSGNENYLSELKKFVSDNSLPVNFFSFTDDVSVFYKNCSFVIVPSEKPEPFGRVAIEAFSYGKPVIATNHGGVVEIVDHGINGFLFEPNHIELSKLLINILEMDDVTYRNLSLEAKVKFKSFFTISSYKENLIKCILDI